MTKGYILRQRVWAIVPVKRFSGAKQRLASFLSVNERARLAEVMLRDVLASLSLVRQFTGIAIVSADRLAQSIARSYGASIVNDPVEAGVNAAVRQGISSLKLDASAAIAIVPADIPFATAKEFSGAIQALDHDPVVLTPAETDGGTNLLALRYSSLIEPSFGEHSFKRHRELARAANLTCRVYRTQGIGHDIDRFGDLIGPSHNKLTLTHSFIKKLNVSARLTDRGQRSHLHSI